MPDTLRKDLTDLVWSTVETYFGARSTLLARLGVENRSRQTEEGWLKELIANAPADFATMKVRVPKLTHGLWTNARSLGREAQAFRQSATDFSVERTGSLEITIRYPMAEGATEDDLHLGDEVVNALFDAGPKMDEDWIVDVGEASVEERETRDTEQPQPGMVATVTLNVKCKQMGRALLTAINS